MEVGFQQFLGSSVLRTGWQHQIILKKWVFSWEVVDRLGMKKGNCNYQVAKKETGKCNYQLAKKGTAVTESKKMHQV